MPLSGSFFDLNSLHWKNLFVYLLSTSTFYLGFISGNKNVVRLGFFSGNQGVIELSFISVNQGIVELGSISVNCSIIDMITVMHGQNQAP